VKIDDLQEILRIHPQDQFSNYLQYPRLVKVKIKKIWKNLSPAWLTNEMAWVMTCHWHQVVKPRHFHLSRCHKIQQYLLAFHQIMENSDMEISLDEDEDDETKTIIASEASIAKTCSFIK
jgi:hypothetical protein